MKLYKHKNNTDVAAEVIKYFQPHNKDYVRIKVRWWRILNNKPIYCMGFMSKLTTAESYGKPMKERTKYPLKMWNEDWKLLEV